MKTNLTRDTLFLLVAICNLNFSVAAKTEKAIDLYFKRNYYAALEASILEIKKDSTNAMSHLVAGACLLELENKDSAIYYFERAKSFKHSSRYVRSRALLGLSYCFSLKDNGAKIKENLEACIKLKRPKKVITSAKQKLIAYGLDEKEYGQWKLKESTHFNFYFDNIDSIKNIEKYIQSHENAFDSINLFFNATLPHKIAFYVWRDDARAKQMMGNNLAFAYSEACIIHTSNPHSLGHEMTHCISYYAAKPIHRSKLIAEGLCVYFDLTGRDGISKLKTLTQFIPSVADVWRNSNKVDNSIVYPLGGELVKRLIQTFGKEKFMQLLADQTYESAQKIYGAELNVLLKKLDEDLLVSK